MWSRPIPEECPEEDDEKNLQLYGRDVMTTHLVRWSAKAWAVVMLGIRAARLAGHDQNVFDFTQAVKYSTEGKHPNRGFTMYSSPPYMEFCTIWTRHVDDVKKQPALMVVYVPGE
jgi:hypothetical protein